MRPLPISFAALSLILAGAAHSQTPAQPSLWSDKPDADAFEKIVNGHLSVMQQALNRLLAVKGVRTIENTLSLFDAGIRELNCAQNFSSLMEAVHPDAAFRD